MEMSFSDTGNPDEMPPVSMPSLSAENISDVDMPLIMPPDIKIKTDEDLKEVDNSSSSTNVPVDAINTNPRTASTATPVAEKGSEKKLRHKQLSLQSKLELLADVDNKIGTKREIAAKYGIPSNTLSTIVKHRYKVETAARISIFQPGRKRMRESNYADIDRQLFAWVRQAQFKNEPVNTVTLLERADFIAQEIGAHTFKASSGWIDRFKKRHGVVYTKIKPQKNGNSNNNNSSSDLSGFSSYIDGFSTSQENSNNTNKSSKNGESSTGAGNRLDNPDDIGLIISSIFKQTPTNKEAAKEWSKGSLPYVLDEYQPSDIFCADETELFFRCLPDKLQSANKGKGPRDKVTVLIGVNMTGMEKLPLLIIGKLATSTSATVKNLPLDYIVDKCTTMTPSIFESWLQQVDEKFQDENRRVALIVNSSQAHASQCLSGLSSVKVIFLPLDTTGLLHPCSQGIAHAFKMHYRTRVVQKYILHARNEINKGNYHCADSFSISITNALFCMRAAWDQVERNTIENSFRHAGFHAQQHHPIVEEAAHSHLTHLLERLGQLVPVQTTASAFVDIDKDLQTSTREFISDVVGDKEDGSGRQSSGTVSASSAMKAIETLKKFAQEKGLGEDVFQAISTIEFKVESAAVNACMMSIKSEGNDDDDDTEDDNDDNEDEDSDDVHNDVIVMIK